MSSLIGLAIVKKVADITVLVARAGLVRRDPVAEWLVALQDLLNLLLLGRV